MADEANIATPAAAPKVKTIADDMPPRRIFANPTEATAYLNTWTNCPDWETTPLAAPGVDEEGNFDSAIYSDAMNVMISTLKNKGKVKAIVVAPVPKVQVLLDSDAGKAWVEKILNKELNHVAVRHLRDAEDVSSFVDQMPTTVDGYIASERGTGGIMETYNELYKAIDAALGAKIPAWSKARFTKGELKKALESRGYALEFYSTVEDYKGQSLFEKALETGIIAAKRKGLDPAIFQRWKDTRNAKTYEPGEEDDEELDLDALADALLADDSTETPAEQPAPAAEGEGTAPAPEGSPPADATPPAAE